MGFGVRGSGFGFGVWGFILISFGSPVHCTPHKVLDRLGYLDLLSSLPSTALQVLHDSVGRGQGKAIDAFAWNGANLLVAVDDFLTPKWMVSLDLSVGRRPAVLGRVGLPSGVNEEILDALFLGAQSLVSR